MVKVAETELGRKDDSLGGRDFYGGDTISDLKYFYIKSWLQRSSSKIIRPGKGTKRNEGRKKEGGRGGGRSILVL